MKRRPSSPSQRGNWPWNGCRRAPHKSESLQSSRSGIVNSSMQLGWGGATSGRRDVPCLFDLLIRKGGGGGRSLGHLFIPDEVAIADFFLFLQRFVRLLRRCSSKMWNLSSCYRSNIFFGSRLENRDKKLFYFLLAPSLKPGISLLQRPALSWFKSEPALLTLVSFYVDFDEWRPTFVFIDMFIGHLLRLIVVLEKNEMNSKGDNILFDKVVLWSTHANGIDQKQAERTVVSCGNWTSRLIDGGVFKWMSLSL